MLSRMLGPLAVICLGAVVMFVFFATLGGIAPGEVVWPTIVVGVLALLILVRSMVVRHELGGRGSQATLRSVNALRERRGF
jgi:tetrahydromethanopterin S-methyltransferase subunit E